MNHVLPWRDLGDLPTISREEVRKAGAGAREGFAVPSLLFLPFSTEDSCSLLLFLSSTSLKKKKSLCYVETNNTSSMGGRPPRLGHEVKGHQWKEGKGGGTITASAAGPPSLPHPVATVCRPHLLAAAHSELLSPG